MKVKFKLSDKSGTIGKIESCSLCRKYLPKIYNRCYLKSYKNYHGRYRDGEPMCERGVELSELKRMLEGTPLEKVIYKIIENTLLGE